MKKTITNIDLNEQIIEFYRREDISRVQPGRKDVRVIESESGETETHAKLILCNSLNETFQLFKEEFGSVVGRTKFCELRPKDVCVASTKDQTVCACIICENVDFLCAAAGLKSKEDDVNEYLCENASNECKSISCEKCPIQSDGFIFEKLTKDEYHVQKWAKGILEKLTMTKENFQKELE